jgi:hypothetical protein
MKKQVLVFSIFIIHNPLILHAEKQAVAASPNGIQIPLGYQNWRMLGTSHRTDNNSLRIILGNSTAIKAAKAGKTNPWPNGSILAKIVWKDRQHPDWQAATVPGELIHTEFMFKDSTKYRDTKGWGYARWKSTAQSPMVDAGFDQSCLACHEHVSHQDYVFTKPATLP